MGIGLLVVTLLVQFASGASPELHSIMPTGGQRGTSVALALTGVRLEDSKALLLYEPGISVEALTVESATAVKAVVSIAGDCALGEHSLRLRTASGITELRTFWVGALPVVAEVEPQNEFNTPQVVPLNCTVSGVVTNEDVDYFAIEAKAGQRITAEIEAMRLGRALFDPAVAILDAKRFELASSDDSALLLQDSCAACVAPADGTYVIRVREASYGGGDTCAYRLHVGTFPRPTIVYPLGGTGGETLPLRLLGDALGAKAIDVTLPPVESSRWSLFASDDCGVAPSANWMRIANFPSVRESAVTTQPAATEPASRTVASPPIAFDGMLGATGESDTYSFAATKGRPLDVQVLARRLRSPLDSVLEILDVTGKVLASNDDAGGPDAAVRFDPPADGEYAARIRDQLGRGGPTFVYRIEIQPPRAELSLTMERVDGRRPQFLQALAIPRGNRMAALMHVNRREVDGPVALEAAQLPNGVAFAADALPTGAALAPIVLSAAADAPVDGGIYPLRATLGRDGGALTAPLRQDVPLVIGPPNDTTYYSTTVEGLAVAVVEEAPVSVQLAIPSTGVLRSGATNLRVIATRGSGFAGPINVQMLWNPPGVSSAGVVTIPEGQNEVLLPINAAGDAPLASYRTAVLAKVATPSGDVWVSSALESLRVDDVFVNGSMSMVAIERGKPGSLLCKLESKRAFEGRAVLTLCGLPAKTAAPPIEISSGAAEAVFTISTEADAPVGQHGGLFVELSVPQGGEQVTHRFASGSFRIDAPPPVAAAAPPQPPPAAAPPKPLSRVEQLRQEASSQPAAGARR